MIKLFCFDFLTHPLGIISEFWCLATETFEFTVLYNNIYRKKVCDNFAWSKTSKNLRIDLSKITTFSLALVVEKALSKLNFAKARLKRSEFSSS